MLKKSIAFAVLYFIALTLAQIIFKKEIHWGTNVFSAFLSFFFMLLILWSSVPYQWKKDKEVK